MIVLHRLLGLTFVDLFTNSPYRVDLEKDLSRLQQLLDVVIIKLQMEGQIPELPDGLENLARYNLLSYKSWHETLDSWVLDELFGHYVNSALRIINGGVRITARLSTSCFKLIKSRVSLCHILLMIITETSPGDTWTG